MFFESYFFFPSVSHAANACLIEVHKICHEEKQWADDSHSLCLCAPLSALEPTDRYSRTSVGTLLSWGPPQPRTSNRRNLFQAYEICHFRASERLPVSYTFVFKNRKCLIGVLLLCSDLLLLDVFSASCRRRRRVAPCRLSEPKKSAGSLYSIIVSRLSL
jgi:hypothetical protein